VEDLKEHYTSTDFLIFNMMLTEWPTRVTGPMQRGGSQFIKQWTVCLASFFTILLIIWSREAQAV
jgi:hypothetical protein